jgi:hypothetical protein
MTRSPVRRPHVPAGLRSPHLPLVSEAELGESPWPPILAVLATAGLYATLPTRFAASSGAVFGVVRWLVPALAVALLVPLVLTSAPSRAVALLRRTGALRLGRRLGSLGVIALMSAANGAAIVLLVHILVTGEQTVARQLLRAAIHMWTMNVLVFALWFWELDSGGPLARCRAEKAKPDFLFPQQATPEVADPGWRPTFVDYLYVSFTNATAFSPTDTMPLSRWAKMAMLVESAAGLLLAVIVAARAVNILQ